MHLKYISLLTYPVIVTAFSFWLESKSPVQAEGESCPEK